MEKGFKLTRLVNAPKELVWEVFTNEKHLQKWWGPKGFTNTFQEFNMTPGGRWKFIMHGPDGTNWPNLCVFREVKKFEKLVFMHSGEDAENDPHRFLSTITFEDKGKQTLVTMSGEMMTVEAWEQAKKFGALEGGKTTLDKLEEILKELQNA